MENLNNLIKKYNILKAKDLKLDLTRGKPCKEQVALSMKMLEFNKDSDFVSKSGVDYKNYGIPEGIPEMREFFAKIFDMKNENFIIGDGSSLSMMFDAISTFMVCGQNHEKPWAKQEKIKWLCPVPGYDRHFTMCEFFGIEMINIEMQNNGPDMDKIEELIAKDRAIKGIWCVPKYSNPQGIIYSDEVIKRFANLKPIAKDFKIFWDNAYFVHDLTDSNTKFLNLMKECEKSGNEAMPIIFCSTAKITFPGAGVAALAAAGETLEILKKSYSSRRVCPDKMNQMRHFKFLKNKENLLDHMKKHRNILKPKFDIVLKHLNKNFKNGEVISWCEPKGGYFVSVQVKNGTAKKVVKLCKDAGLALTEAGATYPYKLDPKDSNIRIAPTFSINLELETAMEIFCLSCKIAAYS